MRNDKIVGVDAKPATGVHHFVGGGGERHRAAELAAEFERERQGYVNGMGGLLMIGDPDQVAQTLADLSRAGVRGIGFSFVNYLQELPFFCDEVLPRLERMGIREKRR